MCHDLRTLRIQGLEQEVSSKKYLCWNNRTARVSPSLLFLGKGSPSLRLRSICCQSLCLRQVFRSAPATDDTSASAAVAAQNTPLSHSRTPVPLIPSSSCPPGTSVTDDEEDEGRVRRVSVWSDGRRRTPGSPVAPFHCMANAFHQLKPQLVVHQLVSHSPPFPFFGLKFLSPPKGETTRKRRSCTAAAVAAPAIERE